MNWWRAACLILAGVASLALWGARTASREALMAEEAAMRAAGLVVARKASQGVLRREAASLAVQVRRVEGVSPGARVERVATWSTGEIALRVTEPSEPAGPQPADERPVDEGRQEQVTCRPGSSARGGNGAGGHGNQRQMPAAARPLSYRIRIEGVEATIEGGEGALVPVGKVRVWRTWPEPETLLAESEIRFGSLHVDEKFSPSSRHAALALAGAGPGGLMAGAMYERTAPGRGAVLGAGFLCGAGDCVIFAGAGIRW